MNTANRLKEHFDSINTNGSKLFIALQGSQNYGLEYKDSDIDTKMIITPSLEEIALNKSQSSYTFIMDNEEHCDVKDIRVMFNCFKKQNINFLEILFSKYQIINRDFEEEILSLLKLKEEIAHYDNYAAVNCMAGMCYEKYNALKKPYPTTKWKIDKWGYDGKQLHHILRMENFLYGYICEKSFEECLTYFELHSYEELMVAKKQDFSLEIAEEKAKKSLAAVDELKRNYQLNFSRKINKQVEEEMNNILVNSIKKQLVREVN